MDEQLLILYATETASSQQVAERIHRESKKQLYKSTVYSINDYPIDHFIHEHNVIFVLSTTGQGDFPSAIKEFWKFLLRKSLPPTIFDHLNYAVFGLGDTSYSKYNYAAKKLFKRLLQLGATPIIPRGDGDDQHFLGVDGALDPWLIELWRRLREMYPCDVEIDMSMKLELSSFTFEFISSNTDTSDTCNTDKAKVIKNNRLTPSTHFQDVREFQFEIDQEYEAGDVFVLEPKNLPKDVQSVLDFFEWNEIADDSFILVPRTQETKVPKQLDKVLTIRSLLINHLDIFGIPNRYFFNQISHFISDPQIKEKLEFLSSAQGQYELHTYINKPRRTTFEVFQDFPGVRFGIEYLLDLIPIMKTRSFSISSCETGKVGLTVAVVEYTTKIKGVRRGVCTRWMKGLAIGDLVEYKIKKATLKLPPSTSPIILIAPGTGIAPIKSILEWRISNNLNDNWLFFGCRNESCDFFYRHEFEGYVRNGKLKLFTAFSRDQDEKVYVQHKILEQGERIWELISNQNAYIYLSGNAKQMPTDVTNAFKEIFKKYGNVDADEYFEGLEKKGRFQRECWS